MRSRWKITFIVCVVLIAAVLAGCGADTDLPDKRPALGKIEYTNLNDSGSRELLKELLSDTGVSDRRIQSFFRRVDRFHDSVKQEWLTDGFEEAEPLYTEYDPYGNPQGCFRPTQRDLFSASPRPQTAHLHRH